MVRPPGRPRVRAVTRTTRAAVFGFCAVAALPTASAAARTVESAWVQVGHAATVVRATVRGSRCPEIELRAGRQPGRRRQAMLVRAQPAPPAYPELVCEATLPDGASSAGIAGRSLPLPVSKPQRIVVLGDTGCRIEPPEVQACNDPKAWPFRHIAASAAAEDPDLVIHVGDLLYRQDPCPEDDAGCAGSPYSPSLAAINADFFKPARELLGAAPWVFVRGNHETCKRDGASWFRYLELYNPAEPCLKYTRPYQVSLGGRQRVGVLDSSDSEQSKVDSDQVSIYSQQLTWLGDRLPPRSWLLVHHPFWAVGLITPDPPTYFYDNATLAAVAAEAFPHQVGTIISGHVHFFELLGFEGSRPTQFMVGGGGTELDPPFDLDLDGLDDAGAAISEGFHIHDHGFGVLARGRHGRWSYTQRNVRGHILLSCSPIGKRASCETEG